MESLHQIAEFIPWWLWTADIGAAVAVTLGVYIYLGWRDKRRAAARDAARP